MLLISIGCNLISQSNDVDQLNAQMKSFRSRMRVYAKCLTGKCTTQERNVAAKAAIKDGAIVVGMVLALASIGILARIYGPRLMQKPRHEVEALNIEESKVVGHLEGEGTLTIKRVAPQHAIFHLKLDSDDIKQARYMERTMIQYPLLKDYVMQAEVHAKMTGDPRYKGKSWQRSIVIENKSGTERVLNEWSGHGFATYGNPRYQLIDGQWKLVGEEEGYNYSVLPYDI
jgi:hypothetical protein